MTIGNRIKEARQAARLTQKELAQKAGTATGTIQQYELGKRQPRIEQLQRIADVLGVSVNYLLKGTDKTSQMPLANGVHIYRKSSPSQTIESLLINLPKDSFKILHQDEDCVIVVDNNSLAEQEELRAFFVFYERFIDLCEKAGVESVQVADAIGISRSRIRMWKLQGTIPDYETIKKLADYFGVTVDYLQGKADFPYPDRRGKTVTFQPWTKADQEIFELGGFQALVEFGFLSEDDRAEALKDVKKFVEFTLSKYRSQDALDAPNQSGRVEAPADEKPTGGA